MEGFAEDRQRLVLKMDNNGDNNKNDLSGLFRLPYKSLRFRFIASILPAIFFVGILFVFTLTAFVRSSYDSRIANLVSRIISRYGQRIDEVIHSDDREELSEILRTIAQNNNFLMLEIRDNQNRTHAGYFGKQLDQNGRYKEYIAPFEVEDSSNLPETWHLRIRVRQDFFFRFIDMFMVLQLFLLLILFSGLLIATYISFDHLVLKQLNKLEQSLKRSIPTSMPEPVKIDSFDEFSALFSLYNNFIEQAAQLDCLSKHSLYSQNCCISTFDLKSGIFLNPETITELIENTNFARLDDFIKLAQPAVQPELESVFESIYDQFDERNQGKIDFELSLELEHNKSAKQWIEATISWNKQITTDFGGLVLKDISQSKLLEQEHLERETNFKEIFDNAPVGLWQSRGDRFTVLNKTMANLLGYESQDTAFKEIESIRKDVYLHTLDYGFFSDEIRKRGRVKGLEIQVKRRSGQFFWAEVSGQAYRDYSSLCVFGSLIDITQRKLSEDALRRSEQLFRAGVGAAKTLCYAVDLTDESMSIQGPVLELLGPQASEIATIGSFLKIVLPEDLEKVSSMLKCKTPLANPEGPSTMDFRICCPEANGHIRTRKLKLVCSSYVQGSAGQHVLQRGTMSLATDARQQIETSIVEKDRVEQLIREIRNPLNAISGFCELLKEHSNDETTQRYANSIVNASKNLTELTSVLLAKIALGKQKKPSHQPDIRSQAQQEYKQYKFSQERVLIADDVASNRQMLFMALTKANLEVIVAEDGFEAVRMAKLYKPHLILMDIMMPRKDGIAAAKELKADPACSKIPIVAITVKEKESLDVFDEYLYKPVRLSELFNVTKKFLRLSEATLSVSNGLKVPVEAFEQIENPEILRSRLLNIVIPELEKIDSEKNFESIKKLAITVRKICLDHSFNFLALEAEQLSVGSVLRDTNAVKESLSRVRACIKKFLQVFGTSSIASI